MLSEVRAVMSQVHAGDHTGSCEAQRISKGFQLTAASMLLQVDELLPKEVKSAGKDLQKEVKSAGKDVEKAAQSTADDVQKAAESASKEADQPINVATDTIDLVSQQAAACYIAVGRSSVCKSWCYQL